MDRPRSSFKGRILMVMQRLGKALMLPVSVLPAAAIFIGIGYWMDPTGFGEGYLLSRVLVQVGLIIMDHVPILFALGVSLGMAKDKDGTAALSGLLNYLVLTRILSPESVAFYQRLPLSEVSGAFYAIANQFTGILSGLVGAYMYNRFSSIRFPEGLAYFSGKRFVPIISSFSMVLVSFPLYFIWPLLYEGLILFGIQISNLGSLGAGIYGFLNRLLIPLGLHHPLNSVFWFDVIGINDIGHFWRGIGDYGITGRYQAGFFPIMMFGLPGAALAMGRSALKGQKRKTRSFMGTSSLASFLTGITEPLEFSFMFVAPGLYLLHALFTGISLFLAAEFQWIAGFSFSAGLTDFMLSTKVPMAKDMGMLVLLGIFFFFLYYGSFTFVIHRFQLKTPGRERKVKEGTEARNLPLYEKNYKQLAKTILKASGGIENIRFVDACITRLRLDVVDEKKVSDKRLRSMGAMRVFKQEGHVQVVIGPEVQYILEELKSLLDKT